MPTTRSHLVPMLLLVGTAFAPMGALRGQQSAASSTAGSAGSGTKRALSAADLLGWKSIRAASLSPDGRWFAYQLVPNEGDAQLVLRSTSTSKELRFPIGEPPSGRQSASAAASALTFSDDSRWLAFASYPTASEARRLKKDKKPPHNAVSLVELASGTVRDLGPARRFAFAPEHPTVLAALGYPAETKPPAAPQPVSGADLLLVDLGSGGGTMNIGNVGEFAFDHDGRWLAWTVAARDQLGNGVQLRELRSGVVTQVDGGRAVYTQLAFADSGAALAVLRGLPDSATADTLYSLVGYSSLGARPVKTIVTPGETSALPDGMTISADAEPQWSDDLSTVFFGIRATRGAARARTAAGTADGPEVRAPGEKTDTPKPGADKADDPEHPTLVLWNYKDPRLQSQQMVEEPADRRYAYLSEYRLAEHRFIRLADDTLRRDVTLAPHQHFAVASSYLPYEMTDALQGDRFRDIYVVDLATGARRLAVRKNQERYYPSPDGRQLLYYDGGHYFTYDLATGATRNLTKDVPTSFIDREDDHNVVDPAIAPVGWAADGSAVLLSDNWDIWLVPVRGGAAVNLTVNGKRDHIRYDRRVVLDPKEKGIDLTRPIWLLPYGDRTKKGGVARVDARKPGVTMLRWGDAALDVRKARDADVFAYTEQTFTRFPDYWATGPSFENGRRLTDANPQQADVAFSSGARLVDYVSDKGDSLQAALFLPANYEPGRKYPTIVTIYEKLSQNLHDYVLPNATRAMNPSVYTSRGYAVLMPDIVYRVNDPGMSAVWCVIPAVKAAIATGIVDPDRVGLQGHSWGGYQTAFLVTQTDLFKAAAPGAPLTDMVSMYSSVYGNAGVTDQVIFERSQGRFRGPFWENMDAYERNSPNRHLTSIHTPLLMIANDRDGAVDFNQGITFFNSLRRLGKPVVMLEYLGENHNLANPVNQKDYAVRMREFFDHFLLGAPAPDWWTKGVPRLEMEQSLKSKTEALVP